VITQAVINFFVNIFGTVVGAVPGLELPAWYQTVIPFWNNSFVMAEGFRVWVPIEAFGNVLTFSLSVFAIIIAIRVVRIMVSLFSGGGGSAA
jgi:hypothetical protein